MTVSVAVVCEAPADRITITTLAERVIREAAPWIEPEAIGDYIEWRGFRRSESHLEWTSVKGHADELKLVVRFRDVTPLQRSTPRRQTNGARSGCCQSCAVTIPSANCAA